MGRKQYIYQITQDNGRTAYFNSYLGEVLKGVVEDGLDIRGVFAWSMLDNFEWNSGLSSTRSCDFHEMQPANCPARFGVQYVDYNR